MANEKVTWIIKKIGKKFTKISEKALKIKGKKPKE